MYDIVLDKDKKAEFFSYCVWEVDIEKVQEHKKKVQEHRMIYASIILALST